VDYKGTGAGNGKTQKIELSTWCRELGKEPELTDGEAPRLAKSEAHADCITGTATPEDAFRRYNAMNATRPGPASFLDGPGIED
jgi:hypothetical protein